MSKTSSIWLPKAVWLQSGVTITFLLGRAKTAFINSYALPDPSAFKTVWLKESYATNRNINLR